MPYKLTMVDGKPLIRKCKYCDKPAKINYHGIKRRHKGYYRTCGSAECLSRQYTDHYVNRQKRYIARGITSTCEHCGEIFTKGSFNQRWCRTCVPSSAALGIMQRYNISYPEYIALVENTKECPICSRVLTNPAIDHDHKTGKIRGIICMHCNTALNIIEDPMKLQKALAYLGRG